MFCVIWLQLNCFQYKIFFILSISPIIQMEFGNSSIGNIRFICINSRCQMPNKTFAITEQKKSSCIFCVLSIANDQKPLNNEWYLNPDSHLKNMKNELHWLLRFCFQRCQQHINDISSDFPLLHFPSIFFRSSFSIEFDSFTGSRLIFAMACILWVSSRQEFQVE